MVDQTHISPRWKPRKRQKTRPNQIYIYRKKIRRNKTITYTKLYTIKTRKTTNKSIYIYLWYIYIQEITLKCSIEVICILNNNENIIKCISKIQKKNTFSFNSLDFNDYYSFRFSVNNNIISSAVIANKLQYKLIAKKLLNRRFLCWLNPSN